MRVLLIEDEASTAKTIKLMLYGAGLNVYGTRLGEDGLELGKIYDFDIICLDLNLPDINGIEVLKRLRAANVRTPVLVLTIDRSIKTKITAFENGADDYVIKPFHADELIARIYAIVRRSHGHAESVVKAGNLSINLNTHVVTINNVQVPLTGKEYAMLELLALRKGMTVSKEMFLNHLYGGLDEPDFKIIDVFICKLRKKLMLADDQNDYIETIWRRGHVLRDVPEPVSEMTQQPDAITS